MFCSIYKWKISQAMDSGKSISGFLQRHLQRCDSCRDYAKLCTALKPKFTQDKKAFLEEFNESLNKKIMDAIPDRNKWGPEQEHNARARKHTLRRPALIPTLVAALTVVVISISVIFLALPRSKQRPALGQFSSLISAASPEDVLARLESPLEKEYTELKQVFESTSKYLISSLDFRLGPQAK